MDIPVEISFTNIDPSPEIERQIEEKVKRLNKLFEHMITCRVAITLPHRHHQHGNIPRIRIEMSIPGSEDLIISHEPNHMREKYAAPDIAKAINEAFRAAERRLKEFKKRLADSSRVPRQSPA